MLVNIFGGITRCEDVAKGLVEAIKAAGVDAPVVVRLDGNAAEEGHAVLKAAALPNVTVATDPGKAVRRVVSIARKRHDVERKAAASEASAGNEPGGEN